MAAIVDAPRRLRPRAMTPADAALAQARTGAHEERVIGVHEIAVAGFESRRTREALRRMLLRVAADPLALVARTAALKPRWWCEPTWFAELESTPCAVWTGARDKRGLPAFNKRSARAALLALFGTPVGAGERCVALCDGGDSCVAPHHCIVLPAAAVTALHNAVRPRTHTHDSPVALGSTRLHRIRLRMAAVQFIR